MRKGLSPNYRPNLGRQLSAKVSSGAITGKQAKQTAYERQVLAKAFGSDWRTKIYGKGGAQGLSGAFSQAQIRTKRAAALKRAKVKLGGGLGQARGL